MIKSIVLIAMVLGSIFCSAQTNLVPNPTFEKIGKKIKYLGQIIVAEPWVSPTLAAADLYVAKTKNYSISIPDNAYGEEKPMKGSGYAGIMGYSYKNKMPRTYLQVQLTQKLKAGTAYCVRYHVSLADLSKYATNHMGVAITKNAVSANNTDVLKVESFVESRKLAIYEKQFYWTPICGVFKAEGGEQFLTIGNFTEDENLTITKVKRPRGFSKPQTYDAYYYVDNVSVIELKDVKKCDCDFTPGDEEVEVIKKDFSSDQTVNTTTVKIVNTDGSSGGGLAGDSDADGKVGGMKIIFEEGKYSIAPSLAKLDKVVAYLKENIDEKVKISGYIDEAETTVAKLAGKRVGGVYKYLVSKGVSKGRIERSVGGVDSSVDKKDEAKNRRVEIAVIPM
jgi:outer membrane protein OmpA-like peptidoglycan-associated protein